MYRTTLLAILVVSGVSCSSGSSGQPPKPTTACVSTIAASQPLSASCCPGWNADACGAGLFCEMFDGRTVPTCYAEGSRLNGKSCTANVQCVSGACDGGACKSKLNQPCGSSAECAPDVSGNPTYCSDSKVCVACPLAGCPDPPRADYPAGPYGLVVGKVFPPLTFTGLRNGTGEFRPIELTDYYDPTGSQATHALLINVAASWSHPSNSEASRLVTAYATTYKARGASFLTAMIQDAKGAPATQTTVTEWVSMYNPSFDIVFDPDLSTTGAEVVVPRYYVIDPRTMKIVSAVTGSFNSTTSSLNSVLFANTGK